MSFDCLDLHEEFTVFDLLAINETERDLLHWIDEDGVKSENLDSEYLTELERMGGLIIEVSDERLNEKTGKAISALFTKLIKPSPEEILMHGIQTEVYEGEYYCNVYLSFSKRYVGDLHGRMLPVTRKEGGREILTIYDPSIIHTVPNEGCLAIQEGLRFYRSIGNKPYDISRDAVGGQWDNRFDFMHASPELKKRGYMRIVPTKMGELHG
ncbi:hypothetical protein ACFLYT_01715 [Nanoarchaeota archaeon]